MYFDDGTFHFIGICIVTDSKFAMHLKVHIFISWINHESFGRQDCAFYWYFHQDGRRHLQSLLSVGPICTDVSGNHWSPSEWMVSTLSIMFVVANKYFHMIMSDNHDNQNVVRLISIFLLQSFKTRFFSGLPLLCSTSAPQDLGGWKGLFREFIFKNHLYHYNEHSSHPVILKSWMMRTNPQKSDLLNPQW